MNSVTPMLAQYNRLKEAYAGCLLLFRLGDFYELFGEDAEIASRILQITLTSREAGRGRRIPMCGVPYHAADSYIATLVHKGFRVAICEQLEDPKKAKGVVKRDVVRVVTPGTITDVLPEKNQFLVSLAAASGGSGYGLAACDLTTGEFTCTEVSGAEAGELVLTELHRLQPTEILQFKVPAALAAKIAELGIYCPETDERLFITDHARRVLLDHFDLLSLEGFGCEHMTWAVTAAGALLSYLIDTQKSAMDHITRLVPYSLSAYMILDAATRRNLELTRTARDGQYQGSLLSILDRTETAMGARLLRQWLEQPLISGDQINRRLDAIDDFRKDHAARGELGQNLKKVHDIERLLGRVAMGTANARDLLALAHSLEAAAAVQAVYTRLAASQELLQLAGETDPCLDVARLITLAVHPDPPVSVQEGGIICPGYNAEVDRLRAILTQGQSWVSGLEKEEREKTGIKSLKIGYNKVFGYYIEVTRPNLALVPDHYERKQTLAGSERFITPELKQKEEEILGAEERLKELEYDLFCQVRSQVAAHIGRMQELAGIIAKVDVYQSLADVAVTRGYCRPTINTAGRLTVKNGRHPVVEVMRREEPFVPNDIEMEAATRQILLITGPNMAGKSTYLRQTALIVLLAHVGSFVPADEADIPLVDRIFTRVGAADDLAAGQSTFMVEMNEVANILNNATANSLVILDEVGRGTSTFDGLSIAWAVTEYLHESPRCRPLTLFATHYHELTELEELLERVHNVHVAVKEEEGRVVFLRRIVKGGANRSYGLEVARLAGLPSSVLARARQVLDDLEQNERARMAKEIMAGELLPPPAPAELPPLSSRRPRTGKKAVTSAPEREVGQLALFAPVSLPPDALVSELAAIDPDDLTPRAALQLLYELHRKARERLEAVENTTA